ncbi:MAG: TlpA family protein disulfide reductase [Rufibacter sp.]
MKKFTVGAALMLCALTGFSQSAPDGKRLFSETEKQINQYRRLQKKASENKDEALVRSYRDSVKYALLGAYIDNFEFRTLDNRKVALGSSQLPLVMVASASWCKPCLGEIPALNQLAKDYAGKVRFMVLFQDTRGEKLDRFASLYGSQIDLVPSIRKGSDPFIMDISGFRHIMGYPTNYFITGQGQIVGYTQGAVVPRAYVDSNGQQKTLTSDQANTANYRKMKKEIENILSKTTASAAQNQ